MKKLATGTLKLALKLVISTLIGAVVMAAILTSLYVNSLADLSVWHEVDLEEEFSRKSNVSTFAEYIALEERLFTELKRRISDQIEDKDKTRLNRFHKGSLADPGRWPKNWNRTYEMPVEEPTAGVVLLHGMSDSPYSLRHIGALLHRQGTWVVGLRVPGHGTAPSGLTRVRWEDMAAAVRIAVKHVRSEVGDAPIYLCGYSNGGALSVEYALSTLEDDALPRVAGIFLFSPMIGVTPAAAFAIWQERIGRLFGIDALKYTDITPEYDPFKYGSFAVNAGNQTYRLTHEIRERIAGVDMSGFPRVLAFQSAVDSTVSAPDLIEVLMKHLPENGSELVLFDINRQKEVEHLMKNDPADELASLLRGKKLPFTLTVLSNRDDQSREVVIHSRRPEETAATVRDSGVTWPREVFSVGHIAIPFPESDPLYGNGESESPGIALGNIAWRGERGALAITPSDMLRIRWNPFFGYLKRRIQEFTRAP
ncbi:MAG: alpha/beta hydrolase [Planctomycetota bacterium]